MTMKALALEEPGEQPVLAVRELPIPTPGPGEALLEVAACGFCYHDVAVMRGTLRRGVKPNVVLGHEISGRIADVGSDVSAVKTGDRVVTTLTTFCGQCDNCFAGREYRCYSGRGLGHALDGGFAQYVCLPQSSFVPLPDGIDLTDAALLGCPIGVALRAARDVARVRPGETALVTGAGGGLGVHAAQIAAALGARTLAVTGSPEKIGPLEEAAPCEVILSDPELDFSEIALALTEDAGVEVAIDTVGSATFRSALRSLSQFGRLTLLGEIAGERVRLNLAEILFRDATINASTGANPADIRDAAAMVAAGRVTPVVSARYALEDAAEAYAAMRERRTFGRVVVVPFG